MGAEREYDAIVVGASLAGCAAATFLARQGARVALVEKQPDPAAWKTLCTHFIQPSATPTLERLGLTQRIEAAGGVRNGLEVWTRYGWIRPEPGPDYPYPSYGYDIRREKLDPMVRELAAQTDGVDLLSGETVVGLPDDGGRPGGVRVRDRSRSEREIAARMVVAADGRDSGIARLAGVRGRVLPHGRFGYYAYYRDLPLVSGNRTLFWFMDPDVAYAFPQDDDLTLLACFLTKDQQSWFKRDVEANFEDYFDGLPNAPDLSRATRTSKLLGRLEMPNVLRKAGRPGLAFVGDAAMSADPVWGVGCGWALQSGEWLADEVGGALAGGSRDAELDEAIERYARRHRRELLPHYLMTSDYSTGRRFSPVEKLLFKAAARDRRVAEGFHAIGSRSASPLGASAARTLARAAFVVATGRDGAETAELGAPHDEGAAPPASVARSRISVDGLQTWVSQAGDAGSDEAVVFVHGNPGSSRDWDDLLARAAPFARGVAIDMPAFGRSERPHSFDYTVKGYSSFLDSALRELGVERAHIVLHDFGGPWGLAWAARNPEKLASAVLINTGVFPDYSWHYLARIWRTPVAGELFMKAMSRNGLRTSLRHGNPRGLPRAYVDRMYDSIDDGTKRAILALYRATDDPAGMSGTLIDALRPLDRPALVIWGAHDPYLPKRLAERQRDAFPAARVEILPDSGHWPFIDDPDSVGRLVEPFLREVVGERAVSAA